MIENPFVSVLERVGYDFDKRGDYYRSKAVYRHGDNPSSLVLYPKSGYFYDFVTGQKGKIEELVALSLNIPVTEVNKTIKEKFGVSVQETSSDFHNQSKIEADIKKFFKTKKMDDSVLAFLKKENYYWNNRGISDKTLDVFCGGVFDGKGTLSGRYVFPIYDYKKNLIGLTGRTIINAKIRWMHYGKKNEWVYPLYFNKSEVINSKSITLVEGVGDMLALWESGVKNVCCIFGTSLNLATLNFCLRASINKFTISTNSDDAGQKSAKNIESRLSRYFNTRNIKTILPPVEKDWNEELLKNGADSIKKQFAA